MNKLMISERKTEKVERENYLRKYTYDINNKSNYESLWEHKIVGNKKYRINKTHSKYLVCICSNISICFSSLGNTDSNSYEKAYEVSYNFLEDCIEARYLELDEKESCHKSEVVDEEKLNEHIKKVLRNFEEAENDGILDEFSSDAIELYELLISNLEMVKVHAI